MTSILKKESGYIKLVNERVMWIKLPSRNNIFWDTGSFRPDINLKIGKGIKYKANVIFDEENLSSGKIVIFPRYLEVNNDKFVNVR